jgi:hypothetical protein
MLNVSMKVQLDIMASQKLLNDFVWLPNVFQDAPFHKESLLRNNVQG